MGRIDDHEPTWPLVVFTVFGPASVGCLLGAVLLAPAEDATFTLVAISVALALGATAVLFSLAHLSKPRRAYRALRRFPVSALSREIAAYALYLLVTAIAWVVEVPGRAPAWLMILGVAAGAIAVVASAQVYLLPARPTWRHWSTIGAFLGCALSLGLSTALLLGEWTLDPPAEAAQTDTARWLALGGIAVTAIALAARSGLLWLRIFVGITLAAVALALSWSAHGWIFAAWPALLVGELLDRRLFFAGTVPLSFRAEIPGVR
jgi:DMSO reductase anchor subunit